MITPDEYECQWNNMPDEAQEYDSGFVRATYATVEPLSIPRETKHWLTVVGLPKWIPGVMADSDSLAVGIPTVAQVLDDISGFDSDVHEWYVLANEDNIRFVCTDFHGRLWLINMDTMVLIFFLNSSLPQFAETLLAKRRFHYQYDVVIEKYRSLLNRELLQEERFDELMRVWQEWENELVQIDTEAMKEGTFWFEVVNQFVLG